MIGAATTTAPDSRLWNSAAVDDHVGDALKAEPYPTPALLETWAAEQPERLLSIVERPDASLVVLSNAAEALGAIAHAFLPAALVALRVLLRHDRPIVREGAVYGLERIAERSPQSLLFLQPLVDDPSPGVRAAVQDALADG